MRLQSLLFALGWISSGLADFVKTPHIQPKNLYPNELSYQNSIDLVANNEVLTNDDSSGVVWFNTTDYCLKDFRFREIGYHAVVTYKSYNYLVLLTQLAEAALEKGYHGDYVFLLFKFLHEGRELPTQIRKFSPMVYDMAKSLDSMSTFKSQQLPMLEYLQEATELEQIQKLYGLVAKERKARLLVFSRNIARKFGRLVLNYKDDTLYFVFTRILGVPVTSTCFVGSIYDKEFESYDLALQNQIDFCHNNPNYEYFGQACSIKLILPRISEKQTGQC